VLIQLDNKPVRMPEGIKFPIVKGALVAFIVDGGKIAQSNAVSIRRCRYSKAEKKIYITVETSGSIYQDAPVSVRGLPACSKDQIIETGQTLSDPNGNPIIVSEILQITEVDGVVNVIFQNSNKDVYSTPFILA